MKKLCIYHGHCDDGFAAAYIVRQALGDAMVEFHAGVYQQSPPDVTGRDVIMVDFSYKRSVILEMASKARSMLILDHHKTAEEDLAGIGDFRDKVDLSTKVTCIFDMQRSGAGLTWDFFMAGLDRPLWVDYVEDRDLWRKQLPQSDEFTIALRSYPQTFEAWDELMRSAMAVARLLEEGQTIQRYYRQRIEEMKRSAYLATMFFEGRQRRFWIANAPYFAASEVAGELCERGEGGEFGACYFEVSPGRWQYSLRSRNDFDVSKVALKFGGGGHQRAAGFTVEDIVHDPV